MCARREPAPEEAATSTSSEMSSDVAEPETSVPASDSSTATAPTTIDTDPVVVVVDSSGAVSPVYASSNSAALGDQEDELIEDAAHKYFDPETNKAGYFCVHICHILYTYLHFKHTSSHTEIRSSGVSFMQACTLLQSGTATVEEFVVEPTGSLGMRLLLYTSYGSQPSANALYSAASKHIVLHSVRSLGHAAS
jgi:hypothetical protein